MLSFFVFFCVVFMFPNVSPKNKKLDRRVGGCGLTNPIFFSAFWNFVNLIRPLRIIRKVFIPRSEILQFLCLFVCLFVCFFLVFLLVRLFVFACLFVYSLLMAGSYECCLLTLHRDDLMSW